MCKLMETKEKDGCISIYTYVYNGGYFEYARSLKSGAFLTIAPISFAVCSTASFAL